MPLFILQYIFAISKDSKDIIINIIPMWKTLSVLCILKIMAHNTI